MSNYLFIQSQDPFTETRAKAQYALAQDLQKAGHTVRIVLVQNGVTPARNGAISDDFDRLLQSGVSVMADDFSLRQREIESSQLKSKVSVASIGTIVDAMLAGDKVIWN